jgi:NTP pyrophosphatase (non-canonical NTP hydrolase)
MDRIKNPTIVISGSFRRHYAEIKSAIKEFESLGITVLSPRPSRVINPGEQFAILESDETNDPKILESRHLDAVLQADAFYLCNPGGYIGDSVKMELGFAVALGKSIFCMEPIEDVVLNIFAGTVASPERVKEMLAPTSPTGALRDSASLPSLQAYVREMVARRGFSHETPRDIMLLFVEEVGELAKAMRKRLGMKTDPEKQGHYGQLEGEFADVLLYLLDLANAFDVSLIDALRKKEQENEKRVWK